MNLTALEPIIWNLDKQERKIIYTSQDGTQVSVTRTDKICPHDFRVGLVIGARNEFFPTHIRLLFDLYLKRISNKRNANKLFCAFEEIYDDANPNDLTEIKNLEFEMKLDHADTNLYYGQLLMLEQEFNYGSRGCKEGNVSPPREFLMRFIRWIASGDEEIDRIVMVAVRNFPPPKKYEMRLSYE